MISRLTVSFKRFKIFSRNKKSMLIVHINEPVTQNVRKNLRDSSSLILPKIIIPSLSGNYAEWTPFADVFQSTDNWNRTLTKNQKTTMTEVIHESKACRVTTCSSTNRNYGNAMKLLLDRYTNKCMIAQTNLYAIFEFRPMLQESAEQLRELVGIYVKKTTILEAMGLDVDLRLHLGIHNCREVGSRNKTSMGTLQPEVQTFRQCIPWKHSSKI